VMTLAEQEQPVRFSSSAIATASSRAASTRCSAPRVFV
jgi:hypothetical protein